MIICKFKDFAFCGVNPMDAYEKLLNSDTDLGDVPAPSECDWFRAQEVGLKMSTEPLKKALADD